jgi:hypothetical protein
MKKNRGTADKLIRILVAALFAALYFTHIITGTLSIILLGLATVFILTAFIGSCPLYLPFKINTNKKSQKHGATYN